MKLLTIRETAHRAGDPWGEPSSELPHPEVHVLGSVMRDPVLLERVAPRIKPEHFQKGSHRIIYRTMLTILETGSSPTLERLHHELVTRGLVEKIGGAQALLRISQRIATTAYIDESVNYIVECYRRQELGGLLHQALTALAKQEDVPQIIGTLTADLDDLETGHETFASLDIGGSQLLRLNVAPRSALVGKGLFRPKTYTLIYGKPGQGKSHLMIQLGVCRAFGIEWLGFPASKGRTGIISLEETREDMKERLSHVCEHYGRRSDEDLILDSVRFLTADEFPQGLDLVRDEFELVRWIREQNLDLVFIDPVSDAHNLDENSNKEMRQLTAMLMRIWRRTGVALALVHHNRKSSPSSKKPDDSLDAARGARLVQSCDAALHLTERRGRLVLLFPKVRSAGQPEPVFLERIPQGQPDEGCLKVTAPPPDKQVEAEANKEKVAKILVEANGTPLAVSECRRLRRSACF